MAPWSYWARADPLLLQTVLGLTSTPHPAPAALQTTTKG